MTDENGNEGGEGGQENAGGENQELQSPVVPDEFKGDDGQADVAKLLGKITELSETQADKTSAPEKYEFALTEDVKDAQGNKIELDPEHPMLGAFAEMAKEANLSQEAFGKIATLYAKAQVEDARIRDDAIIENGKKEIAKLGANANDRLKAVDDWLIGKLGDKAQEFIGTLDTALSYETFEALIKVLTPASSPNGASQGLSGRGTGEPKTLGERMYPEQGQ